MKIHIPLSLLLALTALAFAPPAEAGDCIDLGDGDMACYGDNHFQEGACDGDGGGFEADFTGVLVISDAADVMVGGFNGCTTEGEYSTFEGMGVQIHGHGVASAHARYDHENADEWEWCAYSWSAGTPVYGVGGSRDCAEMPYSEPLPVLPWGHLEP